MTKREAKRRMCNVVMLLIQQYQECGHRQIVNGIQPESIVVHRATRRPRRLKPSGWRWSVDATTAASGGCRKCHCLTN